MIRKTAISPRLDTIVRFWRKIPQASGFHNEKQ